eukprot:GHVH01000129.1.p1 GENE.GHVH01000129.1~~GHVH01000129.1.p1  ORF type:complete len:168 (-),score=17.42 GHVH01000129.1:21-524(-)
MVKSNTKRAESSTTIIIKKSLPARKTRSVRKTTSPALEPAEVLRVYGIPNCSTVKKGLAWLAKNKVEYQFIDYKKDTPSEEDLIKWMQICSSKGSPDELKSTNSKVYRSVSEEKKLSLDNAGWAQLMRKDPTLIKRPLFVKASHSSEDIVCAGFRDSSSLEKILDMK